MRKFITTTVLSLLMISLNGQINTKQTLPANLKKLTPPDLQVTNLEAVNVSINRSLKKLEITVRVAIKNNGQLTAVSSVLGGFIQNPEGTTTSRPVDERLPVPAIDPGKTFSGEFVFRYPYSADVGFRLVPFELWVRADAGNVVKESNETNNASTKIRLVPPAQ